MMQEINKNTFLLQQPSQPATQADLSIGKDLEDTLRAHHDRCVGMAANMIGVMKRIIIVNIGPFNLVMYNPVLIEKSGPYQTTEGCLSLEGERETKRFKDIVITYRNQSWQEKTQAFSGFTAQIIQHELDHLEGILI